MNGCTLRAPNSQLFSDNVIGSVVQRAWMIDDFVDDDEDAVPSQSSEARSDQRTSTRISRKRMRDEPERFSRNKTAVLDEYEHEFAGKITPAGGEERQRELRRMRQIHDEQTDLAQHLPKRVGQLSTGLTRPLPLSQSVSSTIERGQLIGGEEFRALEAALAFFDDGCSDENFSSDHSSDDSASSVHGGVCNSVFKQKSQEVSSSDAYEIERIKAKLVIPGRNRSRDLQKLELLQLRVEAAALQENLKKLRQASLTRRCDTVALDAWKGLAKKQKRLRRDAEITNKELRVVYAKQIETMKAIKRIFRKQAEAKRSACILRNFFVNAYYDVEKDAVVVIERLSSTLNKVFADTDRVFLSNGLLGISSTYSNTYTQPLSATSTHIEVLKCGVLPFDFRVVADAFYGKLTACCGLIKVENVNTSKAKIQNVIARAFTVEVEERVKIQYRDAAVRYSEYHREVIVLAGQNELMEAFGVVLDGVSFYETARCVMSELAPGLCLLQLCIGLTVEATHIALCREFTERLHEMLAHLKREVFDVAQRESSTSFWSRRINNEHLYKMEDSGAAI